MTYHATPHTIGYVTHNKFITFYLSHSKYRKFSTEIPQPISTFSKSWQQILLKAPLQLHISLKKIKRKQN